MKKTLLLMTVICLLTFSANAQTNSNNTLSFTPFAGFEITGSSAGMTDGLDALVEDTWGSFTVLAGVKTKTDFPVSISVFYQKSGEEEKTSLISGQAYQTKTEFKAFGVDAAMSFPMNDKLDLTGSMGIGRYEFDARDNFAVLNGTEKHLGTRFGIGFEYKITGNLAINSTMRYIDFDYDSGEDFIEDMTEFGIGVKVLF